MRAGAACQPPGALLAKPRMAIRLQMRSVTCGGITAGLLDEPPSWRLTSQPTTACNAAPRLAWLRRSGLCGVAPVVADSIRVQLEKFPRPLRRHHRRDRA